MSENWRSKNGRSENGRSEKWRIKSGPSRRPPSRSRNDIRLNHSGRREFSDTAFIKDLTLNNDADSILKYLIKNLSDYSEVIKHNLNNDLLISITEMNVKLCASTLITDKFRILKVTLSKDFVSSWNKLISTSVLETTANRLWKSIEKNLSNIILVFENALDLMPSLCWFLIKSALKIFDINKELIKSKCSFSTFNEFNEKLIRLVERIELCEARFSKKKELPQNQLVPDDYRKIPIFPSTKELVTSERNFMRKNIVTGSYNDIPHYLDVLFRLQREDFLNPIREDLCDYLSKVNRHFFNIKIFEEVTVLDQTFNKDDICFNVEIKMTKKIEKRLKDESKKKFMNNCLLVFSEDDFRTTFCGLVVESDSVSSGLLKVAFLETLPISKRRYKMVECIIFFEPYYHVLKVLQTLSQDKLPMSKYIIEVQTSIERPKYLTFLTELPKEHLNESQEKAFQGALNQEFVVIQGPPGTGKTFLGLKITEHLLQHKTGPILIVTYTNHALDQFLEGLLPYTKKIIRVGSQSKSKKLSENHNLRKMRRAQAIYDVYDERMEMGYRAIKIQGFEKLIQALVDKPFGIFEFPLIMTNVRRLQNSCFSYFTNEVLLIWLLQDSEDQSGSQIDDYEYMIYNNYLVNSKKKSEYLLDPSLINEWLYNIRKSMNFIQLEIEKVNAEYLEGKMSEEEYDKFNAYYDEELNWFRRDFQFIHSKLELLTHRLEKKYDPIELDVIDNPFKLSIEVRWQLYSSWIRDVEANLRAQKAVEIGNYRNSYAVFNDVLEAANVETMKKMDIIGMTTTCAARMHDVLKRVGCPIVVVEEAAEVLEAHIVTVLTEDCEHLILLGDHQQLKPSTSDYVIEKDYKLGVSLFERMVKNNIQCHTLNVQHRMRPEIASLISPVIYPDLKNHDSVYKYPKVKGVEKSLYFIDHTNLEEEYGDSSKLNNFEAQYLAKLAEYFLRNGYHPEDITILTGYIGQVLTIQKEMAYIHYNSKEKVTVTSVDNYQGEESKIILLSLVRNNITGNVGFLSTENRICVALSRAKEGLYVMGNMEQLCDASKIWQSIKETLTSLEAVGPSLPLKCSVHGTITNIKDLKDFDKVLDGGCNLECQTELPCGHFCKRKCHASGHDDYRCLEVCLRKLCENPLHEPCKDECYKGCGKCFFLVPVVLPCGHNQEVYCFARNILKDIECSSKETVNLPCGHEFEKKCSESVEDMKCNFEEKVVLSCGHEFEKKCSASVEDTKCEYKEKVVLSCGHEKLKPCHMSKKFLYCNSRCNAELECGHKCMGTCHGSIFHTSCIESCRKENLHCSSRNKHFSMVACSRPAPLCSKKVKKFKKGCSHIFENVMCYQDINDLKCSKLCKNTLACGHRCSKQCSETCSCTRGIPVQAACGHWQNKLCGELPKTVICTALCAKTLPCGHPCPNKCGIPCDTRCNLNCEKKLECGHSCVTKCGEPCACQYKTMPSCRCKIAVRCDSNILEHECNKILQDEFDELDWVTMNRMI